MRAHLCANLTSPYTPGGIETWRVEIEPVKDGFIKWRYYLGPFSYDNPNGPVAVDKGAAFVTVDDTNVENPSYPSEGIHFEEPQP